MSCASPSISIALSLTFSLLVSLAYVLCSDQQHQRSVLGLQLHCHLWLARILFLILAWSTLPLSAHCLTDASASLSDVSLNINGSLTVNGVALQLQLQNASITVSGDLIIQDGMIPTGYSAIILLTIFVFVKPFSMSLCYHRGRRPPLQSPWPAPFFSPQRQSWPFLFPSILTLASLPSLPGHHCRFRGTLSYFRFFSQRF